MQVILALTQAIKETTMKIEMRNQKVKEQIKPKIKHLMMRHNRIKCKLTLILNWNPKQMERRIRIIKKRKFLIDQSK